MALHRRPQSVRSLRAVSEPRSRADPRWSENLAETPQAKDAIKDCGLHAMWRDGTYYAGDHGMSDADAANWMKGKLAQVNYTRS